MDADVVELVLCIFPAFALCSLAAVSVLAARQACRRRRGLEPADSSSDGEQTSNSAGSSDRESPFTARPQVVRSKEGPCDVWPDHWGITLAQVQSFFQECEKDPDWSPSYSMYDVVKRYVKPRTAGTGMGLALLSNQDEPLEVNVMVSHAWAENAADFLRSLELSVGEKDVMFICALSLYQNEDGAGPSIAEQIGTRACESPFRRILEHIREVGTTMGSLWRCQFYMRRLSRVLAIMGITWLYVPMVVEGCVLSYIKGVGLTCCQSQAVRPTDLFSLGALRGLWELPQQTNSIFTQQETSLLCAMICAVSSCLVYFLAGVAVPYRGRMLVVPNRQCDLYSRLWCVYEIFTAQKLEVPIELAHSLAQAGGSTAWEASCSSEQDTQRLRGEIEVSGSLRGRDVGESFRAVDRVISRTRRQARNRILASAIAQAWPMMLSYVGVGRILINVPNDYLGYWMLQILVTFMLGECTALAGLYYLAQWRQGRPRELDLIVLDLMFFLVGSLCIFISYHIGGWTNDSLTMSGIWLTMVGAVYVSFGISILVILLVVRVTRALPVGSREKSAAFVQAEPLLHFILVPLCVFGSTSLSGTATATFYLVSILTVAVCFPSSLIRAALSWDINLRDEACSAACCLDCGRSSDAS